MIQYFSYVIFDYYKNGCFLFPDIFSMSTMLDEAFVCNLYIFFLILSILLFPPDILSILEKMNSNLELCCKSLLGHLERRGQKFPRFYLLSMEDVLHMYIVCNSKMNKYLILYIVCIIKK